MGSVSVTVEIGDPHGQQFRSVEMEADTGCTYTAVPRKILEELGVVIRWVEPSLLADGRNQDLDAGQTTVRLGGKEFSTMVSFAEEDEPSLPGGNRTGASPLSGGSGARPATTLSGQALLKITV